MNHEVDADERVIGNGGPRSATSQAVAEFLRRTGRGTPDEIAELYAEEVDWRVSWPRQRHAAVPWIRPRATRADVADHYRTFGETCDPAEAEVSVSRIIVEGDEAVLIGTSSQLVRTTGKRFSMTFALHLTIGAGLITRHHMYEDSLAVIEAFSG
ncbi:nuclear transport factor 2 family protein [Streptoalloteichus hindustanus]|nr:nuclear transport factor 2 family protein [Streptoalloteichus hindustanus]